jgi:predicted transcriptional regulator
MGRAPTLKVKARVLARKMLSLQRLAEGVPISKIAEELNVTPRQVRTYLGQALEVQSIYARPLSPERVQEFRALEAERLSRLWQKVQLALDQVQPRIGSKAEKAMDVAGVARMIEAGTRVSERLAKLFGLDVPLRIQQEIFKLQINRDEHTQKVVVSFDRDQLRPKWTPLGLNDCNGQPYEQLLGNGNGVPALPAEIPADPGEGSN